MTKIEAIKKEIERLLEENSESENVYDFGTEHALKNILSFIESLEKEPKERICLRCLYYNEKEDTCYFPRDCGQNCLINKNGVCECNKFEDADVYVERAMKLIHEKITKAKKTWEGVDVEKYMDNVREKEKEQPKEIEKEARISPGMLSNFGTSSFVLDVELTQEEQEKLCLIPGLGTGTVKIKILCK